MKNPSNVTALATPMVPLLFPGTRWLHTGIKSVVNKLVNDVRIVAPYIPADVFTNIHPDRLSSGCLCGARVPLNPYLCRQQSRQEA